MRAGAAKTARVEVLEAEVEWLQRHKGSSGEDLRVLSERAEDALARLDPEPLRVCTDH